MTNVIIHASVGDPEPITAKNADYNQNCLEFVALLNLKPSLTHAFGELYTWLYHQKKDKILTILTIFPYFYISRRENEDT